MTSTGLDIQATASVSFAKWSGGASGENNETKTNVNNFESNRTTVRQYFLGSKPTSDGNWVTWAAQSANEPYPILYEMTSIDTLLNSKYFPAMDSNELQGKKNKILYYMDQWCSNVDGCMPPSK